MPKKHSPALIIFIAAVPCISLNFPRGWELPSLLLMWSCLGEKPVLCLGWAWGPGGHKGKLEGPEPPPLPHQVSGHEILLPPPAGRLPAGQPLILPRTLLTPAQIRRVLCHLSSPAPPGPGQQVDVLSNLSLPSESLRD